ncbi:odorant receptor 74a [Drosophila grimshawi]|uniref:Odorant receptor n=1 Tax=Drosophila grimshawi TaxID=7222 RepID=B4JYR0_DROGR|nr:odorant receptor 74a [Drosophila grimshawi]EDV90822.1 GH14347 [Drosophila grimshawi]
MWYQPRLRNGELVKMSWPLALLRRLNPIAWPLDDSPSKKAILIERFLFMAALVVMIMHNEVDIHYFVVNLDDLNKLFEGIPTFLILVEINIRLLHIAIYKNRLRQLLQRFYAENYISEDSDPDTFRIIKRQLLGTRFITSFYMMTVIAFCMEPIRNIFQGRREMLYKQEYIFDNTKLPFYIPLICSNIWVGVLCTTVIIGDLNMLGEFMMHLNARYLQMDKDLKVSARRLIQSEDTTNIATDFHQELVKVLRRNAALNYFAKEVENQFTFRIFITFSFSATLLCVLAYLCYKNPVNSIVYIIWFTAKFMELLVFGYLGSILYETTDKLDVMYYCCDWEQVVYHSHNTYENVQLMKLVILSIELNSKPFALTGLNYFRVTLVAVIKILQGAFSYFTFLTSFD